MKICAVVPARDEAGRIGDVVTRLRRHVAEVVVVDDGSCDDSADEAQEAGARVLRHDRNRGKGAALRTGIDYALLDGFDAVLTCDGDGQHDPEDVPRFVDEASRTGADLVIGARRFETHAAPWTRRLSNRFSSRILSFLARRTIRDSQCGLRLLRTSMLRRLTWTGERYEAESEMLLSALRRGHSVAEVPIRTKYGPPSKFHPVTDTWRVLRVLWRHAI